jgi:hypothetical protein
MSDKQIYADAKILGELVAQKITVNGEYSLPLTDGSAGQVFATDGAGNISLIDVNTLALTHDNILDGTGITWEYDSMTHTFQGTVTLAPFSTTDLPEGDNLYYSDEKVDDRVKDLLQSAIVGTDATNPILWEYDDSLNTLTPKVSLGPFTTDNLSQGATNKYFSNELVDDRVNDLLQDGQVGTSGTPLVWNYNDIAGTLTPVISLAPFDTYLVI